MEDDPVDASIMTLKDVACDYVSGPEKFGIAAQTTVTHRTVATGKVAHLLLHIRKVNLQ